MEMLFLMLMLLVVFNSAMKMSLWPLWPRLAFTLLLGAFAYWSIDYAVIQSKTQIDDWLHSETVLQGIVILVTIESAINVLFCFSRFNDEENKRGRKYLRLLLHAYPSLLVFPVVFYGITKFLFLQAGMDFSTIGLVYAIAVIVIIALCAELAKRLLPANDQRVEAHLWLTVMVCLLSLLLTQKGEIVYRTNVKAVDWTSMALTLAAAVLIIAIGCMGNRIKWKSRNHSKKWN